MRLHLAHPDHGPLLCGNPSTAVAVTTEDKATCLTCLRSAAADHRRRADALRVRAKALHRERNPEAEPLFTATEGYGWWTTTLPIHTPPRTEAAPCP